MKKICLLALAALLSAAVPSYADKALKGAIDRAKQCVVTVIAYGEANAEMGQGTGFFVNRYGHIVTNVHVVKDAVNVGIKFDMTKEDAPVYYIDRVIATDDDADVFIFSVKGVASRAAYLTPDADKYETGEDVMVVGTPMGLEKTVSTGIISGIREEKDFGYMYQITAPISPGSSGSPVMNYSGAVIGIATMQYRQGQNLNFVMPSEKITALLGKNANMTFAGWKEKGYSVLPSTAQGLKNLGWLLYDKEKYAGAVQCAAMYIKARPKEYDGYHLMAACLAGQKKDDLAMRYISYCLRLSPNKPDVHTDMGDVYYKMEMVDKASAEYYQEIKYNPGSVVPYANLAQIYLDGNNRDDAIRILQDGIMNVKKPVGLHVSLGAIYGDNSDFDLAMEQFEKALKYEPNNDNALYCMGIMLLKNYDNEGAMKCYEKLKSVNGEYAEDLYKLIKSR